MPECRGKNRSNLGLTGRKDNIDQVHTILRDTVENIVLGVLQLNKLITLTSCNCNYYPDTIPWFVAAGLSTYVK